LSEASCRLAAEYTVVGIENYPPSLIDPDTPAVFGLQIPFNQTGNLFGKFGSLDEKTLSTKPIGFFIGQCQLGSRPALGV
jgi:hypothetical protein